MDFNGKPYGGEPFRTWKIVDFEGFSIKVLKRKGREGKGKGKERKGKERIYCKRI